jgi:hypothetical protein
MQSLSVIKTRALIAAVLVGWILLSGCVQETGDSNVPESPGPATAPPTPPVQMTVMLLPYGEPVTGPVQFIPGGVYRVGDTILITGTTILSPGNPLLIEIRSIAFGPSNKSDPDYFSGATAVIEVLKGSSEGQNTWRYVLNTSGFSPGEYSLEITGLKVLNFRESASFSLRS